MKELIEKLSSYNIFNYLLPGALFAVFVERLTDYRVVHTDIVIALFLYYFIGLVVSRIGSLLLEPVAKKLKIVRYADYADFVAVSAKDEKLGVLSEANNMYRTLASLFIVVGAIKLYELLAAKVEVPPSVTPWLLVLSLFVLFSLAYRKQTTYITKRIEARRNVRN